ncbi:MAG: hypothetical protein AB8B80_05690 [Marinicellaceae bacterium]
MKKLILLSVILLSFNLQAQFVNENPPTEEELRVNNSNNTAELLKATDEAMKQKNYKSMVINMERVVQLNPHVPALQYKLAEAYSLSDDKTSAYNLLIKLQKQGFYYDIEVNPNFGNIYGFNVFKYIKTNFDANGAHYGEGEAAFAIDKSFSGLLFESIVYDESSESFLMGSIRDGRIIKIAGNGEITELVGSTLGGITGPWATIDMAVDEKNDFLWVASSSITQYGKFAKDSLGHSGIFKYQLSTGKYIKSYLIPKNRTPSLISDMHLTAQGDLYFIESLNRVVLKIDQGADEIKVVFSSDKYSNLKSITSDDAGEILYLSDTNEGIIVINIKSGKYLTIENTASLNLYGIKDLIYDNNGLIFIQSSISPERVMKIQLEDNKAVLKNIIPIESSNPLFDSLSKGVIVGNDLYYIANSQSSNANAFGGLTKGSEWQNMSIVRSDKNFNQESSIEYQEQIRQYEKKNKEESGQ